MTSVRKHHSAAFKAKVALAAIREEATIAEISSTYGIHSSLIHRWKQEAITSMSNGFLEKKAKHDENQVNEIKNLHAKIGQLTVERDFLAEASKRLKLFGGKK